ncbi:MAG: NUDIX domain-containing protein [Lachnospiraceae bacterium]|nr:NUDIX domain-containing protein [Lachnospiraceae bacterium]
MLTQEEINNTNWSQSVAGVCIHDGKVLLARHTYGNGVGKLIIPGGYLTFGELPEETVVREYLEETGVTVKPGNLLGIRFNKKDWYAVFAVTYVEGEARSDGDENSEVIWMDIDEAMKDETVPGLTKVMIECALKSDGMVQTDYPTTSQRAILYTDLK